MERCATSCPIFDMPITVDARRYPRRQIPSDAVGATRWLDDVCLEMDEWIHTRLNPSI